MSSLAAPSQPSIVPGEGIREIDITAGAEALAAMEMARGVARAVCVIAVPISAFVIIGEIHARVPLENRLVPWVVLTALGVLASILAFSFAIRTMRPLVGIVTLVIAAGPALWSLFEYSAGFGPWKEKWQEHVPVIAFLAVFFVPLIVAWRRVARLDETTRRIARPSPQLNGFRDLGRETFGIWPGLRRGRVQVVLSSFFSYLSAVVLWVGVLIVTPVAFFVLLMMRLLVATKGPLDIFGPPVIVLLVFILLIFLQNALRTLARWCSRAALAEKVAQDPRPAVLFLRSFQDDQVNLPERGRLSEFYRKIMNLGVGKRRLDHLLVERFSRYGPALALGVPGEKSLPFGAARVYSSHENWKEVVRDLSVRSGHVILVADSTPGVEWELQTFLKRPLLDKTLFLCAPRSADLRESPLIGNWLAEQGLAPGGVPVLAVFRDGGGSTVVLRCSFPRSSSAFVTAVQGFFRLRAPV